MTHVREDLLPQPGDVIASQYRVDSLIGMGGMGAVFAGAHLRTERAVAIKWMLPAAAASADALQRFIAEARVTARIEHPNVVHIYDFGEDEGAPFLVMERLRGESLRERLDRVGRLSADHALRLIVPAMRGVAEAHREGIIHRDIKPDNIFLCQGKDGSEREAKVVDFGISKLYDGGASKNLTGTGMMMGTPHYMSPEQLNAPKDADVRFDVYALGVVLYETVTGRCPYDAEGIFQLVGQIMSSEPPSPRQFAPEVSPELEAVVLRAMHRDRSERYPDVASLIEALEVAAKTVGKGAVAATMLAPGDKPMTPVSGNTAPIPGTVARPTPPRSIPGTAVLTPAQFSHAGISQPGVSQPGIAPSQPPPAGGSPSQFPVGTPYAAYSAEPPKKKGGGAKWALLGLFALILGGAAAGGVGYFMLGADDGDDTPVVAQPGEPVVAIDPPSEPEPATVEPETPAGVDPPVVSPPTTTVSGSEPTPGETGDEPADPTPDSPTEPSDEPTTEPDETPPVASTRRRRRGRRNPPPSFPGPSPVPQPLVRPVAPPPPRPTPPPRPASGTNGALIIE
ncbi:MAG: serine/threonine protein kinase [Sandaracinaceae bacterium]